MGISVNAKTDYSYLFSSLNTSGNKNSSSDIFGINLSDYASIKNGSYGKLLKAYYAESDNTSSEVSSSKKDSVSYKTEELKKQTLNEIQKEAEELTASATSLLERGSKSVFKNEDMEEVFTAVDQLVKDYNALIDKTEDTSSANVINASNKLADVMEGYEEQLKEFGITMDEDKKLTIDKKTFVASDFDKAKDLFNGQSSLSYLVSMRATSVGNTAYSENNLSSLYTSDGNYASSAVGSVINGYL